MNPSAEALKRPVAQRPGAILRKDFIAEHLAPSLLDEDCAQAVDHCLVSLPSKRSRHLKPPCRP
jgi:hypothetical protein